MQGPGILLLSDKAASRIFGQSMFSYLVFFQKRLDRGEYVFVRFFARNRAALLYRLPYFDNDSVLLHVDHGNRFKLINRDRLKRCQRSSVEAEGYRAAEPEPCRRCPPFSFAYSLIPALARKQGL